MTMRVLVVLGCLALAGCPSASHPLGGDAAVGVTDGPAASRDVGMMDSAIGVDVGEDAGDAPGDAAAGDAASWADGGVVEDARPRLDAGPAITDAGISLDTGPDVVLCMPAPEICNGVDDDCDGVADGDPASAACELAHASSVCRSGACVVDACDSGFDDCNGVETDGCEADLSSPESCGACGRACGVVERCEAGACAPLRTDRLSADGYHTCVLRPSGVAYCWGDNASGQCGSGLASLRHGPQPVRDVADFVDVDAGASHTCGVTRTGSVYCWGYNAQSQLGLGDADDRSVPTRVPGIDDAVEVAAGGTHTCVRHASGRVSCWGWNRFGEVGDGTTVERDRPVVVAGIDDAIDIEAGGLFSCALSATGEVRCWGTNQHGYLGDGTLVDRPRPTLVIDLPAGIRSIHSGSSETCARTGGQLWCWGYDAYGQLCPGGPDFRPDESDERPVSMMRIVEAIGVDGNEFHTTITTWSGGVYSCGNGQGGHLGDGSGELETVTLPVMVRDLADGVSVAIGRDHTCVLRATGDVACWGSNDFSQLGDASGIRQPTPVAVVGLPP